MPKHVIRSGFVLKHFLQISPETGSKELFIRTKRFVAIDGWTVTCGEQITMFPALSETKPWRWRGAFVTDDIPLPKRKNRPKFTAGGFQSVGLQEKRPHLFGKTEVVLSFPFQKMIL